MINALKALNHVARFFFETCKSKKYHLAIENNSAYNGCMLRIILLSLFLVSGLSTAAHAACSNPTGEEGQIVYNFDHNVMQFCNGTTWISMAVSDVTISSLSDVEDVSDSISPGEGQVLTWDNTNGEWIAADGVSGFKIPDDSSVCDAVTEGTIRYNSDKLQLCVFDGSSGNWEDVAGDGVTTGKFVDGTNTADAVYTGGNVGIGTTTPSGLLHVDGAVLGNSFIIAQGETGQPAPSGYHPSNWQVGNSTAACDTTTDGMLKYASGVLEICVDGTGWSPVAGTGVSNGKFVDGTDTNDAVYTTGNVGIGTTSPGSLLDVNGTIRATEICDEAGSNCQDLSIGANSDELRYYRTYTVNTSTSQPIENFDGSPLSNNRVLKLTCAATGTNAPGTSMWILKRHADGSVSIERIASFGSTSSNTPEIFNNGGQISIRLYSHSSNYGVSCLHERIF